VSGEGKEGGKENLSLVGGGKGDYRKLAKKHLKREGRRGEDLEDKGSRFPEEEKVVFFWVYWGGFVMVLVCGWGGFLEGPPF